MELEAAFKLVSVILLFVVLITAAVTDLLHKKVYNWTTLPAIAMGLTLGWGAGGVGVFPTLTTPGAGLLDHLAGLLLGFFVFYAIARGTGGKALGYGDVKLMAAIGALTGFRFTIYAMFFGSLVGAIMGMWVLLWNGALLRGLRSSFVYAVSLRSRSEAEDDPEDPARKKIPYGVALSFGTMVAFFLVFPRF